MSTDSAEFLLGVLNGLTLNVGAPDFEDVAAKVIKARAELLAVVAP